MSTEFATAVALHAFASVPFKKTSLGGPMLTVQVMLLVKSILSLTIRWRASEEIGAAEEYRSGRRVSTLKKIRVVYGSGLANPQNTAGPLLQILRGQKAG